MVRVRFPLHFHPVYIKKIQNYFWLLIGKFLCKTDIILVFFSHSKICLRETELPPGLYWPNLASSLSVWNLAVKIYCMLSSDVQYFIISRIAWVVYCSAVNVSRESFPPISSNLPHTCIHLQTFIFIIFWVSS